MGLIPRPQRNPAGYGPAMAQPGRSRRPGMARDRTAIGQTAMPPGLRSLIQRLFTCVASPTSDRTHETNTEGSQD